MQCSNITKTITPQEIESIRYDFVLLGNKRKNLLEAIQKSSTSSFKELQYNANQIRQLRTKLVELYYSNPPILVKTINCYTRCYDCPIDENFRSEYNKVIQSLKSAYGNNDVLMNDLKNIPSVTISDFLEGFCIPISTNFLTDVAKLGESETQIILAAKKYHSGLEDVRSVAEMVLRNYLAGRPNRLNYLKYKKDKPRDQSAFFRKFHNLFSRLTGHQLKKVHIEKIGMANLPPGLYSISLRSIPKLVVKAGVKNIHHRIAFVKTSANVSYLFDPGIGLIKESNGNLEMQLATLKKYYAAQSLNADFNVAVSRFELLK